MSEWHALNSVIEGDDFPNTEMPWYPSLFFGSFSAGLDISFATEAECLEFIRTEILPALDGDQDTRCGGCGESRNVGVHGLDQGYGGCV